MDLFVEKGFIENFEIEYDNKRPTQGQEIIYRIFSEYTNINLHIDIPNSELELFIEQSELLTHFLNYNPNIIFYSNLKEDILKTNTLQRVVLTENDKDWFVEFEDKSVLCYSYNNFEEKIKEYIDSTHFKIDLSVNKDRFQWNTFKFLKEKINFILLSDPYIISDKSGQKIKDNLIPLLRDNLKNKQKYTIFIITDLSKESESQVKMEISKKIGSINSALAKHKTSLYLFNRIKEKEFMDAHDRILYTNYTLTTIGEGFNLVSTKSSNSEIINDSIFSKYTYKRINNHLKNIKHYIEKLEKYEHYNKPYKTNNTKAYKEIYTLLE